jgi:hypothetical protein
MLHTVLLVLAFVLCLLAAFNTPSRVNLLAAGLAAFILTFLI